MIKKTGLFLIAACFVAIAGAQASAISVTGLSCEQAGNPLGIDTRQPRFSWVIESTENDVRQSAYEIIVSTGKPAIDKNQGDVWQTGKVVSDETLFIPYEGAALQPFTRYYWKVRGYDAAGTPSPWSNEAWFETAMLDAADWVAQWIGDGSKQFTRDEDFYQNDPMPLFRKSFSINKTIASARLYICGLGYYEAYINGRKVGDQVLDPGWTAHKKQALYVVHDVTALVQKGSNAAGVMLGNGWYNPLPIRLFRQYNLRDHQQTGRPVVKAQLLIRYTDGTSETISTDQTWKTSPGPVIRNNVYLGEHYDARAEIKNWNLPNIDDSRWKQASIAEGPSGILTVQMQPPVKLFQVVKPVRIYEQRPGVYIADMGINFAGVARIRVSGKAGTEITIRYGENIHLDGSLNWYTTTAGHIKSMWSLAGGPGSPADAIQTDSYTLKGGGKETWSPRFTFHGFRYLEISGWPGKPALNDIEGLRLHAGLLPNGDFACSNDMFNRLHEITLRTFMSNVFSVQSDCPGREKMGYGGDMVATAESFIYNYDMGNFYRKTVRDFLNDQIPEGGMTSIAPNTGIDDGKRGGGTASLGWQLAFPYLQKQLYDFYGDKRIIEEAYPAFVKQMEYIRKATITPFYWGIGDHVAIDPKPEPFQNTAFYYEHARLIAEFAAILGKKEEAARYEALSKQIREASVKRFYVPGTGRFDNATQGAQAFALYYGFSPDPQASLKVLLDEYARHDWHVSTGIFGCKMAFDVLRLNNLNEVAYRIANQRGYPGWGYMVEQGATTLWESWEYPENGSSQNHPMFGSTEEWFYRSLLGINPAKAGFKEIIIKPQPAGDLAWAKGSYRSIRGTIASAWKIENNRYSLSVEIPANTTATVYIPASSPEAVQAPSKAGFAGYDDGYAFYRIPSGKYEFVANWGISSSVKPAGYSTPSITGRYIHIYEPQPDAFSGPDTENLRANTTYPYWQPNDHCFVKGPDSLWHAFGITHPVPAPGEALHQGEYAAFHIVSPGKMFGNSSYRDNTWLDKPKVLAPKERPGEITENHAPVIVKEGNLYRMIYGPAPFRMATSEDLYHWTPSGEIGIGLQPGDRDPNLMRWNDTWHLVYCAGNAVMAATSKNLREWTEPVEIFRPKVATYECESPTLLSYQGRFYLFWCVWDRGDPKGNAYDERTFAYGSDNPLDFHNQPLLAELKAHAPEIFQDEKGQWYISSAEYPRRGVSVAPFVWSVPTMGTLQNMFTYQY
ncbi:hypothetical protein FACS1894181_08980 [Bacteroidia bacterium]|nr:hypothetical protein FACS1894181_08980 [Bacteroidia bacterium]